MNRLIKTKKITVFTLTLFILSGVFTFTAPASADFLSAYQVLKNDYGYVVDRIVAGRDTEKVETEAKMEAQIEAFLGDLEVDINARGELTQENFNSLMYQSFEEVILWPDNFNVLCALLESYEKEIKYTLENNELHPSLIPIRNAVMKSLLGEDKKPPIPGGGGGVAVVPNSDINKDISAGLNKSAVVIQVDVSEYPDLLLPGSLLNEVSRKGKTLDLAWSGLNISLPPGALSIDGSDKLTISAKTLSQAKEAETAQKVGAALKLVGEIFDIKASTLESPRGVIFSKPVEITLTYSYRETAEVQKSLALYYFNEQNQSWEKLSGQHALSARFISVSTNQLGKYALFAAAEAAGTVDPEPVSSNFIDIQGHWAEQDINIMYRKGLVSGVTPFQFAPERNITRAEFAAIMLRAIGEQPGNYMSGRFYDVPADSWYFNVVNKAAEVGIISGYSSTQFGPQNPITREQIAAIISRAMQLQGKGIAVSDSAKEGKLAVFADQRTISDWSRSGVAFAVENNIVKGRTTEQFAPQATATRAEATAMILRMYNQL